MSKLHRPSDFILNFFWIVITVWYMIGECHGTIAVTAGMLVNRLNSDSVECYEA